VPPLQPKALLAHQGHAEVQDPGPHAPRAHAARDPSAIPGPEHGNEL